jgi:hypothetical protein
MPLHLLGHMQFCLKHASAETCKIIIRVKLSITRRVVFLSEKIKPVLKSLQGRETRIRYKINFFFKSCPKSDNIPEKTPMTTVSDDFSLRLKNKLPMLQNFTDRPFGVEIEFFGMDYVITPLNFAVTQPYLKSLMKAYNGSSLHSFLLSVAGNTSPVSITIPKRTTG